MPSSACVVWNGCREGLIPELAARIEAAAREFAAAYGASIEVASGRRTLRRQARLMAAMTDAQLLALYGAGAAPDYVRAICALPKAGDGGRDPEAVYRVLQRRRQGFVSRHLFGGAADIAVPEQAPEALAATLRRHGLNVLDERSTGIACFHVSLPGIEPVIVRE